MENKPVYTLNCEICNKVIYRNDAFDTRCDEHNKKEYLALTGKTIGINTTTTKLLDNIEMEINKIDARHYIVPTTVLEARIVITDCISQLRENDCSGQHTTEPDGEYDNILTKGKLCKLLENCLNDYRKQGVLKSIKQNKHMNNYNGERISQNTIDAILVDFINYIAQEQGLDLGLYTKHLE